MTEEMFNYVIGRPWDIYNPDGAICTYCYAREVHYGTLRDAEEHKKYVEAKTGTEEFIYKLVKLENETDNT